MSPGRRAAIVVAGGSGDRFGRAGGKQLAPLAGRPVVAWCLIALDAAHIVEHVIVVCSPGRVDQYREDVVVPLGLSVSIQLVEGGSTRRMSVLAGLDAVPAGMETVVVHDGARPLVTAPLFTAVVEAFEQSGAEGMVVGYPSADTVKLVDDMQVVETLDRSRLWAVQTPQVFAVQALKAAHQLAEAESFEGTDDATLVERAGGRVMLYEGPRDNIKITRPEDLAVAEAVLAFCAGGVRDA